MMAFFKRARNAPDAPRESVANDRDQVWFVEKDAENATRLYPLSDYKPRKGEALQKGYLYGRYGALPFPGELRF
jgi:hypothetical protein